MRELNFLPDWYTRVVRQRRAIVIQAIVTVTVSVAVLSWWQGVRRRICAAEVTSAALGHDLAQAQVELARVHQLGHLCETLQGGEQTLRDLRKHVEAARLLSDVGNVAPTGVCLTDLTLDPVVPQKEPFSTSRPADESFAAHSRVVLKGVAPAAADVAAFQSALSRLPGVTQVAVGYAKDLSLRGRILREFEVNFDLDATGGRE